MDTLLTEVKTDHCLQCGKWLDPLKGRKTGNFVMISAGAGFTMM